jgi:hypothetical protein
MAGDVGAAAITALAWVGAFYLNEWAFATAERTHFVSLVFLPAGVRILAVLILGWPAAIGLFFGSLITAAPIWHLPAAIIPGLISALGPAAAVGIGTRSMRLRNDLKGITPRQIAIISITDGVFNAVPSNLFFWLQHRVATPWHDVAPMFVGDLLGTAALLYLAGFALRLLLRARQQPR